MSCQAASQHARKIDAPVLLEMLVFGRKNCISQEFRNLAVGEQYPPLDREGTDRLAVVRI